MQMLFVFHKNIKFVTFYNFNVRSCLHENLEENAYFCFKKSAFSKQSTQESCFLQNLLYQKICNTVGPLPDGRAPGICMVSPPPPSNRH
jgi:hypothetical protein